MNPEEVMRDFWSGLRMAGLVLFVFGGLIFGAGYFMGVKMERGRMFKQIQHAIEEYDKATTPKIEQEFHWQKLRI